MVIMVKTQETMRKNNMSIFSELFGCELFESEKEIEERIAVANFYHMSLERLADFENQMQNEYKKDREKEE